MKVKKFVPKITIYEKISKHTAIQGEECNARVIVENLIPIVKVENSQGNELIISVETFNMFFEEKEVYAI